MRKHHREIIALAKALGVTDANVIWPTPGAHPRLVGTMAGRRLTLVVGGSPSDTNAPAQIRRQIPRLARGEAAR